VSIGLQISIRRRAETDAIATYEYYVAIGFGGLAFPNATGSCGVLVISKNSGEVVLESSSSDDTADHSLAERAAFKLRQAWKLGPLPADLIWAA